MITRSNDDDSQVTFLENTLLPEIRLVGPNFVPRDYGHLVPRDFPFNPWTHPYQDKCVQKVRLDTSWTKVGVVGFQKYDAHYIVANMPFSLELREEKKKRPVDKLPTRAS